MAPSTTAAADGDDAGITVHLSLTSAPSAPRAPLALPHGASASELRRKASAATSVPLPAMKLIFRGRVIPEKDEGDVAAEFKLEEGCVVHVMGKPAKAESASSAAGAGGSATASPATAGASVTLPSAPNAAAAPASTNSPLAAALAKLRSSNDGPTYRTAVATADKLLGNIVSHPMEEKYRTIKKSNPAFARRLGGLPGGSELMAAAGFTVETREGVEYYVLTPSADAWPTLVGAREEVGRVLAESNRGGGVETAAAPFPAAAPGGAAAVPGGLPGFPGGMPDANEMSQLQSMLGDPSMMQNVMGMMNNPMVQNMMRSDPRFANNPMLQQSLNALQSNPEMMNQFSQMMSDPNARNRMASMMQQQQPGAGAGGANPFGAGPEAMRRQMEQFQQMSSQFGGSSGGFNTGGGTPGAAPSSSGTAGGAGNAGGNNSSGSVGGSGDSEMTEEEMIAEAIARSLRES